MEIKLKITLGQTIAVILLVCIAFAGGFLLNSIKSNDFISIENCNSQIQKETIMPTQCETYAGFTDKDLNVLGNLAYSSGECERQGLISSVMVTQTDKNEVYGIPVCIEGGEQ